jgi:hypothetical protein
VHETAARAVLISAAAVAVLTGLDYIWRNRQIMKRLLW